MEENASLQSTHQALKHEIESLKEVASVATGQTQAIEERNETLKLEVSLLRRQISELEGLSDEHANHGELCKHINQLKARCTFDKTLYLRMRHFRFA